MMIIICFQSASIFTALVPFTSSFSGSRLKIQCDANYSVSALFPLSASNMFSCTSGGESDHVAF